LASLVSNGDDGAKSAAMAALDAEAYVTAAAGLQVLAELDPATAAEAATKLENTENDAILGALAGIYAASGDVSKLPFFEKQMMEVDGYDALSLLDAYRKLLAKADQPVAQAGILKMKELALNQSTSPWRRLAATKAVSDWREELKKSGDTEKVTMLGEIIKEVKSKETEPQLLQIYTGYGN
ncbi:MAG: alanyl aminopeptidase, partial [Bacteroidota bacterium]